MILLNTLPCIVGNLMMLPGVVIWWSMVPCPIQVFVHIYVLCEHAYIYVYAPSVLSRH